MSELRVSVPCPLCAVPVELPGEQSRIVTGGGRPVRVRLTLGTEPLFDHLAEQHGAPVLTLHPEPGPRHRAGDESGQHAAGLVEQRELPESRTRTDTT